MWKVREKDCERIFKENLSKIYRRTHIRKCWNDLGMNKVMVALLFVCLIEKC